MNLAMQGAVLCAPGEPSSDFTADISLAKLAPSPTAWRPNWRFWVLVAVLWTPFIYVGMCSIEEALGFRFFSWGVARVVDLHAMGNFQFDEQTGTIADVPARFRALDGKQVVLRGFMYGPENAGTGLRRFQFVFNVTSNSHRGPPLVQERVFATPKRDVPVFDTYTFAEISGTLHVKIIRDPTGRVVSIYSMDVDSAKQLP